MSHAGAHTPRGRLCLVPSLSVVGSGFIPGAVRRGASLLLVAEGCSRVRGHAVCICSFVNGHLCCFYLLAIASNTCINFHVSGFQSLWVCI